MLAGAVAPSTSTGITCTTLKALSDFDLNKVVGIVELSAASYRPTPLMMR